ncbi:uncharacterized protein LOC143905727 [Temnothorax americanus]|uniref:uncharacterized protein LOC143905727 n=1 Tax=Temnothorax americanus TaxID=1964332 RepID=UPI00406950FB
MKILQLNLNHCEAAHDLLMQTARELELDLDVINNREAGFVAAWVDGIRFYSCYAPPSLSTEQFADFLDRLIEDARQYYPVAIAGDFNSWAIDWGSKFTNPRGKALLEAMATLDVVLLNTGETSTYSKGEASSIVDLTFVSSSLTKGSFSWEVMNTYTASDHSAILWEISTGQNSRRANRRFNAIGWKVKSFDPTVLIAALDSDQFVARSAEEKTKELIKRVTRLATPVCPGNVA